MKRSLTTAVCILALTIAVLSLAVSMSTSIATAQATGDLKMPTAKIVPPAADIPDDIRAFSGKWKGRWRSWACPPAHGLDAILFVVEVTQTTASCRYSWGNDVGWNIPPGLVRPKARFERKDGRVYLTWETKDGVPFHFWIEGEKMKGKKGPLTNNQYEVEMQRF